MVRRVRGRATGTRGVYVGGVMETSTREARAIVRTAVTHVAAAAQLATLRENADVAPEYEIVATLDARTSDVCRAMDRRRFPVADLTAPRPPFHNACRSMVVPVVAWKALGLPEPPPGQRASASGPVPGDWTYEEWLRAQTAAVQRDVLGPGRAKLFAEGRISMRDLVRSDGKRVRLSELEARGRDS
jgi:SPP1 gp7 family putative phage head morphogenesis protein